MSKNGRSFLSTCFTFSPKVIFESNAGCLCFFIWKSLPPLGDPLDDDDRYLRKLKRWWQKNQQMKHGGWTSRVYIYILYITVYIYICISIYTQKIQRILIPRIRTLTNPWCGAFDAEHGNSTHKIEVSWVVGISIYILMYTWISRISYTRCWWKKSGQPVEVDSLSQHLQGFWFISQVVV